MVHFRSWARSFSFAGFLRIHRSRVPFYHHDWLYEIKRDGFRALACIEDGTCKLVSRYELAYEWFDFSAVIRISDAFNVS